MPIKYVFIIKFSRVKEPYIVFYNDDGEAEIIKPEIVAIPTSQETDSIKIRLEDLFKSI